MMTSSKVTSNDGGEMGLTGRRPMYCIASIFAAAVGILVPLSSLYDVVWTDQLCFCVWLLYT